MTIADGHAQKIKNLFKKIADKKITPNNFGKSLLEATTQGIFSKDDVATALNAEPSSILNAGNALNTREVRRVAQSLLAGLER